MNRMLSLVQILLVKIGDWCEKLEVHEANIPGKYLGMPMHMGKNKNEVFGFLNDRVRQKLQGQSNKRILKARKLTILKLAARTIIKFWMNLFLISGAICDGLESQMNGYWWGHGPDGKGIRWMAWEKLCVPKGGGGLGVRSLMKFNIAMLPKQGWRILTRANSLVSNIMQAHYFPDTEFLNIRVGSNSNYMWRSIKAA